MPDNETVQTGQEPEVTQEPCDRPKGASFFELAKDSEDKWHWVLWAKNGRPLALNAQVYDRRNDAATAIEHLRAAIREDPKTLIAST